MPWLADLVESSEGSLNVLPVQCLCEFLLNSGTGNAAEEETTDSSSSSAKRRKERQLLLHLQSILQQPGYADPRAGYETLDYFLRRLASQQTRQRVQVMTSCSLVVRGGRDMQPDVSFLVHRP